MLKFQCGWKLACKEDKRPCGIFRPWMLNMRIDDTEEMSQSSEEEVLFEPLCEESV